MRGEKIVLRVLDASGMDLKLAKLGFGKSNYERFANSFNKPHGMLLVTGPTGSGKSTTLYATLAEISKPTVNIITVEDPVEYRLPGVNQVQVDIKAGLTFAAVLPAILRSDPDVVLIGEIRDRTTAQLAVEAALTGHLVLSTLHTNDAPSAVTRLVEMGIEPFLVGSSVDCVLAQRLARRLCDWCKTEYGPMEAELIGARWPYDLLGTPETLWRPVGCRSCANTGYRGRIALHEVMPVSPRHREARDRPRFGARDPGGRIPRGPARPAHRRPRQGGGGPDLDPRGRPRRRVNPQLPHSPADGAHEVFPPHRYRKEPT
ncbi:GspE/PulE family protein [Dactylosporangium sp. NPDC048998]|uniref:GspE/PulE family protein n=1 Tax=Dactylosporangium sp. NPDC048998 TaxID=3363976 RepID=UPI0037194D9E